MGDLEKKLLASAWLSANQCSHLRSEPKHIWSLSVFCMVCNAAFQINEININKKWCCDLSSWIRWIIKMEWLGNLNISVRLLNMEKHCSRGRCLVQWLGCCLGCQDPVKVPACVPSFFVSDPDSWWCTIWEVAGKWLTHLGFYFPGGKPELAYGLLNFPWLSPGPCRLSIQKIGRFLSVFSVYLSNQIKSKYKVPLKGHTDCQPEV